MSGFILTALFVMSIFLQNKDSAAKRKDALRFVGEAVGSMPVYMENCVKRGAVHVQMGGKMTFEWI